MEVLIATVLLALLMGLAYGAFRTTAASVSRGEALIDRTERMRVAQQFLRRQLSFSMPMMFERVDLGAMENKVFEGDASRLRFVAPMPGYLARGGAHVQTLTLVSDSEGLRLEFEHALLNGFEAEMPAVDARPPVVLMQGARNGGFQYRGMDEEGELEEWQDRWEDPSRLPLMVRLELEWPEAAQVRWPPIEVALMRAVAVPGLGASGLRGISGSPQPGVGHERPGATRPVRPGKPER
jgi:general secretion pathway protein J